jgi:hypothetical protein
MQTLPGGLGTEEDDVIVVEGVVEMVVEELVITEDLLLDTGG